MTEFAKYTVAKYSGLDARRAVVLPTGRRPGGRHDPGASGRPAPAPRLRPVVGARGRAAARPRRVRAPLAAARSGRRPGRLPRPVRRAGQGGPGRGGDGPPRDRGRCPRRRGVHRDRHPHRRRPRARRHHRPGRGPRGRRRLVRGDLGAADRGDGRHGDAAPAARPPLREDRRRCPRWPRSPPRRSSRTSDRSCVTRTATCTSASTSTGWGSGRTAIGRCRWTQPTLLSPAEAPVMPSVLEFTPEDFEESWGWAQELMPALRDDDDRGGDQRGLLVHAGRLPAARRVTRRGGLLGGRGGLGHALRRRRARRWPSGSSMARRRWTSTNAT